MIKIIPFFCEYCGEQVQPGILNVSKHWMNCLENKEGLIIANTQTEKDLFDSWSINVNRDEGRKNPTTDLLDQRP